MVDCTRKADLNKTDVVKLNQVSLKTGVLLLIVSLACWQAHHIPTTQFLNLYSKGNNKKNTFKKPEVEN